MATQGYDPNKAATFNQLRQQGLSEDAAAAQAGISDAPSGTYVIGDNGQLGAPIGFGAGKVAGVDFVRPTAAQTAESARFDQGLQSSSNFEQVDYAVKAKNPPSLVTPINYVTTSTENVSGGGSTATIAGPRTATTESQAFATAASAKQAEINQFYKDNPSNYVRKRQGLPLLTPEEEAANNAQAAELRKQKAALVDKQVDAETPGTPTTITTPNTTTTTQTVTSGTTAVNTPVQAPAGDDPAINQQTEIQLGTTLSNPVRATATSPLPADGDEALAAAQAEQELIDLRIAAESATPVDSVTEGLLLEQEQLRQFQADEELSARLDRAADVPLTDEDAALQAQELADLRIAAESASPVDTDPDGLLAQQEAIRQAQDAADLRTALTFEAAPVQDDATGGAGTNVAQNQADVDANNSVARGATNRAQQQSTLQTRVNQPAAADWRVRLSLAPNATYLYRAASPGILAPLAATNGVIFPYTPSIDTSYTANYDKTDLTHSNYRGYFYKSSSINDVNIRGTFTAQDTREAQYLLAVIHFFRSVTKMFYGQDGEAGTPPPLVYLSGLGQYQFNNHPCVVTSFTYNLPTDVDYIRANGFNNIGLNMENRRTQSSGPAIGGSLGTVVAILDRLNNAGLKNKSLTDVPSPGAVNQNVTNQNSVNSTYVPTKMDISIQLYPIQTRTQVSQQFSLRSFANGDLLKGGFW
jgi:hypothetical protein